jgi:Domain of Unknown Function with PDB structure (DUF3857)/Transglutaminase-like superfamily
MWLRSFDRKSPEVEQFNRRPWQTRSSKDLRIINNTLPSCCTRSHLHADKPSSIQPKSGRGGECISQGGSALAYWPQAFFQVKPPLPNTASTMDLRKRRSARMRSPLAVRRPPGSINCRSPRHIQRNPSSSVSRTHNIYFLGEVPATYFRGATLINDAAALTAAGRLSISFAPEYERVQLHAVRIYREQQQFDKTATSNIRFLQREQNLERGVYSGRITASVLIDDLRVGDTVEVAYTISGQNPAFGGKAFGLVPWDQGLPTLHRRTVLSFPSGRAISWRVLGDRPMPALAPTVSLQDGVRRVVFDEQPLPSLTPEAMTAPDSFSIRLVQFSEFTNWSEVIDWARNLFASAAPPEGEFRDIVKRIKALPSDEARTVAALEFAQSEIRYFSVSLGESSHRPTPPDEVLRRRYGDCKDKSLLLIVLLRELGIESNTIRAACGAGQGASQPAVLRSRHRADKRRR